MEKNDRQGIMRHFVLKEARSKQVTALNYIESKSLEGFKDIVIAAPTGVGKTAVGAATCFWSTDLGDISGYENGGYYLVTQKMLQDQIENDIPKYQVRDAVVKCRSLKSASEYKCLHHGTCAFGMKRKCKCLSDGGCSYIQERLAFGRATMAVTNYPYMFTEHLYSNKLPKRKVLVMDECHGLERQILAFIEISVSQESLMKWAPTLKYVPKLSDVTSFGEYLTKTYLPVIQTRYDALASWEPTSDSQEDKKMQQERLELENHLNRITRGVAYIMQDPDNWVFWQEKDKKGNMEAIAKPLDASPFSQSTVFEMGHTRVYMSAYPGSKKVFCRSLGLDPSSVAWLNLNSTFPVANRQIYMTTVGSMSRKNRDDTMPALIKFAGKIMDCHKKTKGLIHCNSYEIGQLIYDAFIRTEHGPRLLFPKSAADREGIFEQHKLMMEPTVIISPSMTEGFDFFEDLARWQIIAKVPYGYLGDRQVAAKKEMDEEWYSMMAVMSIVQASGRIVRSDSDVGHTYILDSDFLQLFSKCEDMFPKWWKDAMVWPDKKVSR